jgi:hypothetical protein
VKTIVYIDNNAKLKEYTTNSMKLGNKVYSQNVQNDVFYDSQFTIQIIHINKQIVIHNQELGKKLLGLSAKKIDAEYFINDSLIVEANLIGNIFKLYRKSGDYSLIEYSFNAKGVLIKTVYHQNSVDSKKAVKTVLEYSFTKISNKEFNISLGDIVLKEKDGWKPSKKYTDYSVNDNTSR